MFQIRKNSLERSGVIYVDIPPDVEKFGIAFGKALNFAFEERISFSAQLAKKIFGYTKGELIITVIVLKNKTLT